MANGDGVFSGILNNGNGKTAARAGDWLIRIMLLALLPVMGWSLKTTISIDKRVAVIESGFTTADGSILRDQVADLRIDMAREQQQSVALQDDIKEIKQLLRDYVLTVTPLESGGSTSGSSSNNP